VSKSIFVVPIERRSNIGQRGDCADSRTGLPIRTKATARACARPYPIHNIVGDPRLAAPIVPFRTAKAAGISRITIEIANGAALSKLQAIAHDVNVQGRFHRPVVKAGVAIVPLNGDRSTHYALVPPESFS